MMQSTYDAYLLYMNSNGFGVVGLQIDDTLILADDTSATAEAKQLNEAKLLAKEREKLTATLYYVDQIQRGLHQTKNRQHTS